MKMKQTSGLKRNTIDKYYTKESVVDNCLRYVKEHIEINEDDLIIEPSAGNGSFIEGIKSLSRNYRFFDIAPENDEIIKPNILVKCKKNKSIRYDSILNNSKITIAQFFTILYLFFKKIHTL